MHPNVARIIFLQNQIYCRSIYKQVSMQCNNGCINIQAEDNFPFFIFMKHKLNKQPVKFTHKGMFTLATVFTYMHFYIGICRSFMHASKLL